VNWKQDFCFQVGSAPIAHLFYFIFFFFFDILPLLLASFWASGLTVLTVYKMSVDDPLLNGLGMGNFAGPFSTRRAGDDTYSGPIGLPGAPSFLRQVCCFILFYILLTGWWYLHGRG
jgi:hypothetical protein